MAKKETTKKKATKKTTTKRAYNKKVEKPIEELNLVEENTPIPQEVLDAAMKAVNVVKKDGLSVLEEEPIEIPTVQVVNGDPSVLAPVGEPEFISTEMPIPEEVKPAKKKEEEENPHDVTSLVAEEIVNESQPEEYESAKPAKKKIENNHKPSKLRRILGYFWNGQEMDY